MITNAVFAPGTPGITFFSYPIVHSKLLNFTPPPPPPR
jgi:hypothetical protein